MPTDTTTTRRPLVVADDAHVDLLDIFEPCTVKAKNLRPGMLIIDSDGFAVAAIDHRVRAPRNSGGAYYLVENFERGSKYLTAEFHANADVTVAAR